MGYRWSPAWLELKDLWAQAHRGSIPLPSPLAPRLPLAPIVAMIVTGSHRHWHEAPTQQGTEDQECNCPSVHRALLVLLVRRVRFLPLEKAGRRRIGTLRDAAADGGDLVPAHLANSPQNDAIDSGLLNGGAARFEARDQDVAREICVERGHATALVRPQALEIFLDGGLPDARGLGAEPAG